LSLKQSNSFREYFSIIWFQDHFVFINFFFKTKSFQNNLTSTDLSYTLLKGFVGHIDSFEFIFSWILNYVSSVNCNSFKTSFHYTRSSFFSVKSLNSFNSMLNLFKRRSLFFLFNNFKCFFFNKWNTKSFASISF